MESVIIVGGGASGLVAAIQAKRNGAQVIVLESMSRVGKKILATGNGRCNISNRYANTSNYHGKDPSFIEPAMEAFSVESTIAFFEELGVHIKEESDGKLYPYSDQATSVLDALRYEINRLDIPVYCDCHVTHIKKKKKQFVVSTKDGQSFKGKTVIVAVGGKAAPNLGTKGAYELLENFGHSLTTLLPAIVQVTCEASFLKSLKGVKFMGNCSVNIDAKTEREEYGEILFTDYGISGPPVLQMGGYVSEGIHEKKSVKMILDLIPAYDFNALRELIAFRIKCQPGKTIAESLEGLFNKRLSLNIVKISGIDPKIPCSQLNKKQLNTLVGTCKNMELKATGTKSWMNAQVTSGGIECKGFNPKTMESKLIDGLYLTGECLDIHGDCGGYNLQWAWSSGLLAGREASQKSLG